MTLPSPRAVILDWDNTLVDSWAVIHEALNVALTAMGHEAWSLETTRMRAKESLTDAFPKLFGPRWETARNLYLGHFQAIHMERLAPLADAEALIEALSQRVPWLGIVSNKTGHLLRREVEALGWGRYFHRVVGAGDAAADKPDPAAIESALAGSGVQPGPAVWLVGDTDLDMMAACNAGCLGILIDPAHAAPRDDSVFDAAREPGAGHWCYPDCGALLRYVASYPCLHPGASMSK